MILQFGKAFFSSATPTSLTLVLLRPSIPSLSHLRCTSPAFHGVFSSAEYFDPAGRRCSCAGQSQNDRRIDMIIA